MVPEYSRLILGIVNSRGDHEYTTVNVANHGLRSLGIVVRSRINTPKTTEQPLAGMRIAIKDIFALRGIRSSLGNRAYYSYSRPANVTAECVTALTSLGAELIGKTYMSAFALMEHPTQSIECEVPFNPRADGYQLVAGSSGGSASAVASYDWLDFALGTDSMFDHHILGIGTSF